MSFDASNDQSAQAIASSESPRERDTDLMSATDQWDSLGKKVRDQARRVPPSKVFAKAAKKGRVYRWGIAVACNGSIDPLWDSLSRLATDRKRSGQRISQIDIARGADMLMDAINGGSQRLLDVAEANLWAAAMPSLIDQLDHGQWWELLSSLQNFRESVARRADSHRPDFLIAAGEIGLTLSWRLADLPSCRRLQKSSIECLSQWCKQDQESIAASLCGATNARIVFASLIRCKRIIEATTRRKFKKQQVRIAADLATWIAAMTTHTGGSAMSRATHADVVDDVRVGGLLQEAIACDPDSLKPAVDVALARCQPKGRLVWEVCLPESFQHCEDAKFAVMMPHWDARRGRMHIDYHSKQTAIELFAGKSIVLGGVCQTEIDIYDQPQRSIDGWELICEFSDDDVHYLELEQPWSGGIVLQRQILLVRDDCCVLLADSVLPSQAARRPETGCSIRYRNQIPLAGQMELEPEVETREAMLNDGRRRALVMPLSAAEWRVGPSKADLSVTADRHLLLSAAGQDRLFVPLWFDCSRPRFDRNRTWRQLTVAENLRIVSDAEAVGFRVQVGSEQWMIYRTLDKQINRSVLGKHLVAEFFAARFYAGDGSLEELVTVDADDATNR